MLQVRHYPFELEFEYPFTISKGTKTHQPTLIVSLGMGRVAGYGEAPAISYYDVTVESMIEALEAKKDLIIRYALTDPQRFWHFLEHLLPGQHFLIAALDMAGWDLIAKLRRQSLSTMLRFNRARIPLTDYTLGIDTAERMVEKVKAHPWPIYKIKMRQPDDIDLLRAIRAVTDAPFRIDANEAFSFEEAKNIIPELVELGVNLIEQPMAREAWDAMKELKQLSPIPLYADESCVLEADVQKCADAFHGINIKLTKCSGITPAFRMIHEARKLNLKVMMGSMNESTIGSAAIAHLMPLLDEVDVDGPLLLKEDVGSGLFYKHGVVQVTDGPGMGTHFFGEKRPRLNNNDI